MDHDHPKGILSSCPHKVPWDQRPFGENWFPLPLFTKRNNGNRYLS